MPCSCRPCADKSISAQFGIIPTFRPTKGLSRTSTHSMPSMMPRKPISEARRMPDGTCCEPNMTTAGSRRQDTERPALQRLLEDVQAGKVDVIVGLQGRPSDPLVGGLRKTWSSCSTPTMCRLCRVTQQFNTTTSMGRLTLNVLLSFAQFEREVASERIRDKIAASTAAGRGGACRVSAPGAGSGDRCTGNKISS